MRPIPLLRDTPLSVVSGSTRTSTAIVYCEGNFAAIDGKTANGLVRYSERPVFKAACAVSNVEILDVRRPPAKKDLHMFTGDIAQITCPVIAALGTDCAIGKRTTATVLTQALNDHGVKTVMIGTGQTGLIQGARYGIALDAIPSQFCAGELEATIINAFTVENPDVIIIEGQGALSHPAFSSSSFVLPHLAVRQSAWWKWFLAPSQNSRRGCPRRRDVRTTPGDRPGQNSAQCPHARRTTGQA